MRKLRATKTLNSNQITVRIGDVPKEGVLAIPITDQKQLNKDMKAFIFKHNKTTIV